MRKTLAAALLAVPLLSLGLAGADSSPPRGYLSGPAVPDTLRILPPAPTAGDSRDEADRRVFLQTRGLKDTPRWALAHADIDQAGLLGDFACAVGVRLTPQNAPRLTSLLRRMGPDVKAAVGRPKDFYGRKRPYLVDEGPICDVRSPGLAANPDYPSGHTTIGWTYALLLAELAPDRATETLVRGRAYGESRLVCGVHNLSAFEAGLTDASALVAALHGSADFRADLDAARTEVAAARRAGPAPDPQACAAEAALIEKSPY
jgi:acid phosphatase (class A)